MWTDENDYQASKDDDVDAAYLYLCVAGVVAALAVLWLIVCAAFSL